MTVNRPTVGVVAAAPIPDPLPPAISRPRQHVQAVLAQSLLEMGDDGRTAVAWEWALVGGRPSPVTLSLPPGRPPTQKEILAEAEADPEGSTAAPGVPTDFCDQIGEVRRVLRWLIGDSDEIPVDCEDRGRFIGARGDYARTDDEICQVRDSARRDLEAFSGTGPADSHIGITWEREAAWLTGVRDLFEWILGERPTGPLSGLNTSCPTASDLSHEVSAAEAAIMQGRGSSRSENPTGPPPLSYCEAVQAAARWVRGEATESIRLATQQSL